MARWLSLEFATTHEAVDLLADFLAGLGATGVQIEDAADIRGILADPANQAYADDSFLSRLDEEVKILAYFAEYPEGVRCSPEAGMAAGGLYGDASFTCLPIGDLEDLIRGRLAGFSEFLEMGRGYLGSRVVREEDWADNWKKHYQTLRLTGRLVVNPSWIPYRPAAGEIVITLDPGSAFGTGTHETTALCAEWLDERVKPGDRVLDLGTGSGILAIIAARLTAGIVEAIDIDPLAVGVARANGEVNQVDIDCHQGELADARRFDYHLIVANIIADVISGLAASIPGRLAAGGLFLASGIIAGRLDDVLDALSIAGLVLVEVRARGDWRAALFRRNS